jgi:pimeloyl-ACP methyl ester carboxylesterase
MSPALRGALRLPQGVVNYILHPPPQPAAPPLVIFGGTAQTINSMIGHHSQLAKTRAVLQYELRGQGTTTTLPLDDCSLERHVQDFEEVCGALSDGSVCDLSECDLVGFSFGARVALAITAHSDKVRRLVATGVPADRGATGRTILKAWSCSLERGDLEGFLWQSIADGHSDSFLTRHEPKLTAWVKSAAASNRAEAIAALVGQTHTEDVTDPWHTISLAHTAVANGVGPGEWALGVASVVH